jgi:hypothetical protein
MNYTWKELQKIQAAERERANERQILTAIFTAPFIVLGIWAMLVLWLSLPI